jgi:O-antigen/teichoic acid export membrane protein
MWSRSPAFYESMSLLQAHFVKAELEPIETGQLSTVSQELPSQGLRFSGLARDVATMGSGTVLAALFSTLLVFLIPRLISVEDFGYWRLFLLYASYAGLLHVGFLDGLLFRWAGQPLADFHPEVRLSLKFLFWQLIVLLLPACIIAVLALHAEARFVALAVLMYALFFNVTALLQFSLQGARQFKPVAFATAAPGGVFVLLTVMWNMRWVPSFRALIVLYCVSWLGALVYLWTRVKPFQSFNSSDSAWLLGKTGILLGWPMALANIGQGLVQSADRLVVSSALPIYDFAQYSLASSALFVPVTAIAAVYRVFFSYAAALEHEGRMKIYKHASKFLLLAWSVLLPYFFVLEVFVRNFLPKYLPAMPLSAILLLSVLFVAEIQILHTSFAYLYGRQRQFLLLTIGALVLSFSVVIVTAIWLRSLIAIAIAQVGALSLWWLTNEWNLREVTGQRWPDQLRIFSVFAWSGISYGIALRYAENVGLRILLYYVLVAGCLIATCYPELRMMWRLVSRMQLEAAH